MGTNRNKRGGRFPAWPVIVFFCVAILAAAGAVYGLRQVDSPSGGNLTGQTEAPATTEEPTTEPDLSTRDYTLQFAGDILLHRGPVQYAKTGDGAYDFSPYFSEIKSRINGDFSICNMESPVDSYGGNQNISSYPCFNVPKEILAALKDTGFDFLTTANNHAYDQRLKGLIATRNNIAEAGLRFTGTNETQAQYDAYQIVDVGGMKLGIIAYTDSDNGMGVTIPEEMRGFTMRRFTSGDMSDVPRIISDMERCRAAGADFIILSLHWGVEYVNGPNETQKEIARRLAEGGADIIMGNHAHCVQPIEWADVIRDGKKARSLIIYSLGNFFADQSGLTISGKPVPKTQYSMLVDVNIHREKDGTIAFGECSYTPTFCYRNSQQNSSRYRVLSAGAYRNASSKPDVFRTAADWEQCISAYEHVTKVVGSAIPVKD